MAKPMSVFSPDQGRVEIAVDPAQTEALLADPDAHRFEMRGREMDGWLRVDGTGPTYTGNFWDPDSDNVRAVRHGDVLVQKDTDLMPSIAHGSDGLVVCGTTGEAATMTDEEHLGVIRLIQEELAQGNEREENIKVELSEQSQRPNSELDAMGILLDTQKKNSFVCAHRLDVFGCTLLLTCPADQEE